jgi:uncharacterized protein YkwD
MRFAHRSSAPLAVTAVVLGLASSNSPLSKIIQGTVPARQKVLAESPVQAKPKSEPAPATDSTQTAPSEDPSKLVATDEERQFVELTNQERAKRGLGQLTIEPVLIAVARKHSAEMRDRSYFNHESPSASIRTPMDRYLQAVSARPAYACVGENLFYCTVVDVQRGHTAFMNSPKHRENVLFPRFEKMGVGIVKNARGEFWVTEMFLTNTDPKEERRSVAKRMSSSK